MILLCRFSLFLHIPHLCLSLFLCFCFAFPLPFLCPSYVSSMLFLCLSCVFLMFFVWFSNAFLLCFLCCSCTFPLPSFYLSYDFSFASPAPLGTCSACKRAQWPQPRPTLCLPLVVSLGSAVLYQFPPY